MLSSFGTITPDQLRERFPGLVIEGDKEQRRAAWLEAKRGKFGASSSSCLWTPSKTMAAKTPDDFAKCEANNATVRKMIAQKSAELDGAKTPEISASALRWGNDEEGPGMVDFIAKSGINVKHYGDDQVWFEWSKCDQIGATPDGIVEGVICGAVLNQIYHDLPGTDLQLIVEQWGDVVCRVPVEQKNPITPAEHSRMIAQMRTGADLAAVEFKYWVQVQQQIMVLNAPFGIFFTRDKRRESESAKLAWWIVPRNQSFIDAHSERLLRAVQERDDLFNAQAGREWVDLSNFIKQ
jgi:hypothetical protein